MGHLNIYHLCNSIHGSGFISFNFLIDFIFQSIFRFTAKLRFPAYPTPPLHVQPPRHQHPPPDSPFVTTEEHTGHVTITQRPQFTPGFTPALGNVPGLDTCMMTRSHHCSVTWTSFMAESPVLYLVPPPPTLSPMLS